MPHFQRRALLLAAVALPLAPPAFAQQKVWRIGMLETTSRTMNAANLEALRKGLRELGYAEDRNLIIHYHSSDGNPERFRDLAGDLVLEKVDLILARGTPATRAAMLATTTIPIVMTSVGDPTRSGLVKSLARPGGNVTGFGTLTPELSGKRIELLKEVIPRLARIGVLADMRNPNNQSLWQETEKASRAVGIQAQLLDVRRAEDLAPAFETARKDRVGALIVGTDTVTQTNRKTIVELAITARLPTIAANSELVEAGGLMSYSGNVRNQYYRAATYVDKILKSYSGNVRNQYYRAATYVDKILKGAKPGDLPVEEPTMMELTINLGTAKALGVTIPPTVQFRANRLIE